LFFTYDPSTGLVNADGNAGLYYQPNELHKTKTIDENKNEVVEYVDKEGHTVCKKVQYGSDANGNLYACTYYIYDDFGNLMVVLPPEAVKNLPQN